MGLFEKKYCAVCGQKIGLLGNRKLEDGNLCKDCASKLSPFFSERRSSTVDQIKEQLAYREENREALRDFHPTKTLGKYTKVHLDEDNRTFVVTSARNIQEANPDLIRFSQVTGCDVDVSESQTEERRQDKEGRMVSYVPARYSFSAGIKVIIHVNHPYFDTINITIDSSISLNPGNPLPASLKPNPRTSREFVESYNMAITIRQVLGSARASARAEASAVPQAVVCPNCGATTIPDASGCCEYCGGAVGR